MEDARAHLGVEGVEVEAEAEPEPQFVIALGGLELEGMPVDAHGPGLAGEDGEVGAARRDLDAAGFDAGHEDIEGEHLRAVGDLELRLAEIGIRVGGGTGAAEGGYDRCRHDG